MLNINRMTLCTQLCNIHPLQKVPFKNSISIHLYKTTSPDSEHGIFNSLFMLLSPCVTELQS